MSDLHDGLPLVNVKPNIITMVFKRFVEPALIVAYLWTLVRLHGHALQRRLLGAGHHAVLPLFLLLHRNCISALRRNPKGPSVLAPLMDWMAVAAVLVLVAYICEFYRTSPCVRSFLWSVRPSV
jgi:putative colanic acid biosynthesis UDP-glucose lipid carrier transferase